MAGGKLIDAGCILAVLVGALPPIVAWAQSSPTLARAPLIEMGAAPWSSRGVVDCNENGVDDGQDVANLTSPDCNGNDIPDECEINENSIAPGGPFFCNFSCDPDCNHSGVPDECELSGNDCNDDGHPDECGVLVSCTGTSFTEDEKLTASDAVAEDSFGIVSISGDTAVVGAVFVDCADGIHCGAAYVFRYSGTSWIEEQTLTASDAAELDRFGFPVFVSGDTIVVGAWSADCAIGVDCGAAYVYRYNGTNWIEVQKLTASDAEQNSRFGISVSMSGNRAIVGAFFDDCDNGGIECGSAYVFRYNGTSWIQEQKLTASNAAGEDRFGVSVFISGETVVVGARTSCAAGEQCGSAYVFRFDGTSWIEEQELTASDRDAGDWFGFNVSLSDDTAIVSAYLDDCPGGIDCGSVYVFGYNGTSWIQEQKLTASDAADDDRFGVSLSLHGQTVVLGAIGDDCAAGSCGSAYVFHFDGASWTEAQKLTVSDTVGDDRIGNSVAVSGATAFVGALNSFSPSIGRGGAVYVFDLFDDDCNCNNVANICEDSKPDADGDGVPDGCDICLNGDDTIDGDFDGIPDDCDECPNGSNTEDSDGDGVSDGCDACPGSNDSLDGDGDGVPDDCDICPGGDDTIDSDGDGVPDACDVCPNGSDTVDSDGDGVPDGCDVCEFGDDNIDDDGNGVPDACDGVESPTFAAPPHNILKNRYISIDPRGTTDLNVGQDFNISVTLSDTLVNGVTAVGNTWWANVPDAKCISVVGPTQPTTPPNWDACPTLHLAGCPIIPTSAYEIVSVIDGWASDPPLIAATQAKPGVKWHGDCVGFFTGTEWTAPNGQTTVDDAVAAIKTFQNPSATPGCGAPPCNATHTSVTDMVPNLTPGPQINKIVNIADVFSIIQGFQGFEYPGPDLTQCP